MIQYLKRQWSKLRTGNTNWYKLSEVPGEGFLNRARTPGAVTCPEEALSLPAFWKGLRWYQSKVASLPLVTYREGQDGSRTRATTHPAFNTLLYRPNPAMTRPVYWSLVVRDLFLHGEHFSQIRWRGNGNLIGLYPIPVSAVEKVVIDEEWNKAFVVRTADGVDVLPDTDVLHLFPYSEDGIRGTGVLKYAASNLGLHKQIQESANALYVNAARPSCYITYAGRLTPDAIENLKKNFGDEYRGAKNTGKVPVISDGGTLTAYPSTNAEDAKITEALASNVGDVGRWLELSGLALGDYTAAHYANLSADNQYQFQHSLRPVLDLFEAELNTKLFGAGTGTVCEFDTDEVLRGDAQQMATVAQTYLTSGVVLRNEVRTWLNLPPIDGLDTPLQPLNQGAAGIAPNQPMAEVPTTDDTTTTEAQQPVADAGAPVADTALNGAQVASLMAIADKVASREYTLEAAIALATAAFPAMPSDLITKIMNSLANAPAPLPEGGTNVSDTNQ